MEKIDTRRLAAKVMGTGKPEEPSQFQAAMTSVQETAKLLSSLERWGKALISSRKTQGIAVAAAVAVGFIWLSSKDDK